MGSSRLVSATNPRTGTRQVRHAPPKVSAPILRWFLKYARRYVARNLHTVRVSHEEHILSAVGKPLLLYMNHPSWWDPMIAAVLAASYLQHSTHYTPMDAAALEKYRFFARIGFFGVTPGDFESQRKLLEVGGAVLQLPNSVLWLTPQGRFSDVRERPLRLSGAVEHLVRRAPNCVVLPVALEYAFWEERKPEALVRFGPPLCGDDLRRAAEVPGCFELHLEEALDALARDSVRRDTSQFRTILAGRSGVGGVYDLWRRAKAKVAGEPFHSEHGDR